jgi:hypothetical protein
LGLGVCFLRNGAGGLRLIPDGNGAFSSYVLRSRLMTAKDCQHRADEAKILSSQTQDLWERETLLHISTLWQLVASHIARKEARQAH